MPEWRGVNNGVLYSVQFAQELNDAQVDRIARWLLGQPLWELTQQQEYDALAEALRSDAQLTKLIPEPHTENAYRDFLRRVLARLDQARPWPTAVPGAQHVAMGELRRRPGDRAHRAERGKDSGTAAQSPGPAHHRGRRPRGTAAQAQVRR